MKFSSKRLSDIARYSLFLLLIMGSTQIWAQSGGSSGGPVLRDSNHGSKPGVVKRSDPKGGQNQKDPKQGVDGPIDVESNFAPEDLALLTPPKNIKYTVDFRDASLDEVVKFISALTKRNFIIAKSLGANKTITIISPTPVSAAEAYRAFLSALTLNGLTIVKSGAFYKIVEISSLGDNQPNLVLPRRSFQNNDQYITYMLELKYVSLAQIQPVIEQFKTSKGTYIAYEPTNMLIITDTGNAIKRLLKVLNQIDRPSGAGERLWVYQVQYADANELSNLLGQIFETNAKKPTARRTQPSKAKGKKTRSSQTVQTVESESDVVISKIVADERTNKLIIMANDRSYERIKQLILKLDIELPDSGRINVVHLENADANDLAQRLNEIANQLKPKDTRRRTSKTKTSKTRGSQLQGDVSISANEATNDLIIVASPRDFASLRKVIQLLDRPRKQVYVEAVIMEVSLDRTRSFGMALHGGNVFNTSDGDAYLFGRTDLGSLQSLSAAPLFLGGGSVPGLLAAFIGPTALELGPLEIPSVGLILKALQTNSDVNVLSTPTIMTLDNEEAEISVGERIPFIASTSSSLGNLGNLASSLNTNNGSNANATAALGMLGGLGGLGTQIQRVDVALTLRIKPQINDAGYVRLTVEEEIEEVKPGGVELGGPTTRRRNLKTVVVVRDQETVVLGGLIRDVENESVSKVPILGDIPVIGYLFRSTDTTIQKQNLLLLLTPYIIEGEADKQKIYERKLEEYEAFRRYFGAKDLNYIKHVDFDKKHGLLEEIHQTISQLEAEDNVQGQGDDLLYLPESEEGIALPEGMGDGYDSKAPQTPQGN